MTHLPMASGRIRWMHPGAAAERRIYAAANPHHLTSCRINPAFLLKQCDWIFCGIKARSI